MPRKPLIRSTLLPYHVTARGNNREVFPLALHQVWDILLDSSLEATITDGARIHALVLMPNHFHMILSTPQSDLGVIMERLMKTVTKTINWHSRRSGRVFGGPYHWSIINTNFYFTNALKYVYRNPVRAGLCEKVEIYPFSTLRGLVGEAKLTVPLHFPFELNGFIGIPDNPVDLAEWINRSWSQQCEIIIRRSLKKTTFNLPKVAWKQASDEVWDYL